MRTVILAVITAGSLAAKDEALPHWLVQTGLGFLEGFLTSKSAEVGTCIVAALGPIGNMQDGIGGIRQDIKDANVIDIEEGLAALRKVVEEMRPAMRQCNAMEADTMAIGQVSEGFNGILDLIKLSKSNSEADSKESIFQEFEVMVHSLEDHKYIDFGRYVGRMTHHLVVGPDGALRKHPTWGCKGAEGFSGTFPKCYLGSAGLPGLTEHVKLKILTFANDTGTVNFDAYGLDLIKCRNIHFKKKGQELKPEFHKCLPHYITVTLVKYCSRNNKVHLRVRQKGIPIPFWSDLQQVKCKGAEIFV